MLDYKLLEALARVVREGGFDKAARVMNITQSAVSQRVRQLEELTGMVLLTRTPAAHPYPRGHLYAQSLQPGPPSGRGPGRADGSGNRSGIPDPGPGD